MRTANQTAIVLAALFHRSGQSRVRISQTTLKFVSYRERLRAAFVVAVTDALADYGLYMVELDVGGYALVSSKSLEGAKAATAKRYMEDILPQLRNGDELNYTELQDEISDSTGAPDFNE
ncbi:hypothetical protein AVE30378_02544 [Achromobacter veterisilvae]|uniref:Uncharacterized protein n=1 Tax=Achromobacter veterisilvae TaxID=2069367 RepID=A0A446CHA5_9BURK|nr:hypothetical protein [Achromobacter veterisilvae]SSW67284.1 hypothetical protein AVE30378_02544 [Achromobacter veterisilvae]